MKLPEHDAFHLKSLEDLRSEIARLGLSIPIEEDLAPLALPLKLAGITLPNRFCALPLESCDATPDGTPGPSTFRRYTRFAQGGFGLIWVEAAAVRDEARSSVAQLCLHRQNVAAFSDLVKTIRKAARDSGNQQIGVILQLAHSGRYSQQHGKPHPLLIHHHPALDRLQNIPDSHPLVTDDYLDELQGAYVQVARLALEAGFDGVDVKSCHKDLVSELHAASTRPGKYGGSFDNRTRFILETVARIRKETPELLVASRLSVYDAVPYPHGFGVDKDNYRTPDLKEPLRLVKKLKLAGVSVLGVAASVPAPDSGPDSIDHPLQAVSRSIDVTRTLQKAFPDLPMVGSGYSWLRQFLPPVAAGGIQNGGVSLIGMGRSAFAYPDAPADILKTGRMEPTRCCITCAACMELNESNGMTGCVIRDNATYGEDYRHRHQFSIENLREESRRCHYCEAANCTEGCPARIDIPAFLKAFADGDIKTAYGILRRSNVLPEMCSHLCPTWLLCEGACIETTLTGRSIPIRDIQYGVCWLARTQGLVGTVVPTARTGRTIAIVGAGPAGLACAVTLIEKGHNVVILESDQQLGGTPEIAIRSSRYAGARAEIDAILQPARDAGRLETKLGQTLGRDVTLDQLKKQYDAVLLAGGVWQEASLRPERPREVIDALTFLKKAKRGELKSVPQQIAVLSGGDCAMDAAAVALELGAVDLYLVYPGPLSEMHWHMPDSWLRTSGTHCLTLTQPLGYETDRNGKLTGLRICRTELGPVDEAGRRSRKPAADSESVLKVGLVIEAMGLGVSSEFRKAIKGVAFTKDGLVKTNAPDSYATTLDKVYAAGGLINGGASAVQCIAEGMKAAEEIHRSL